MTMKIVRRSVSPARALLCLAAVCAGLVVSGLAADAPADPPAAAAASARTGFRDANLGRIRELLTAAADPGAREFDDYYFVLIGDIQNSVRSFRHDVFEALARKIEGLRDEKTGQPLYDRIRFLILLGDLVYEGPSARQWENLAANFAGRGPDRVAYPAAARLVAGKPVFPALGNHELLMFRLRPQTRYQDLFDSPVGAANLQAFFGWDRLVADPKVLYPVPENIPEALFRERIARLESPADRDLLKARYSLRPDGRFHLAFYDHPSLDPAEFGRQAAALAEELAPVLRRAGYGTLPVLSSDNMVHYGFEAGNVLYLFLDSMSRGWQYPNFVRLKKALYPADKDQHRLNLFTDSPFNGQAGFYRAAAAYAKANGKTLVTLMHHSFFNSSKDIRGYGTGYNAWLGLGFPQAEGEKGDPTIVDDMLFTGPDVMFSACVHAFDSFVVEAKTPGLPDHELRWFISGGGGGPPRLYFYPERIKQEETYFNEKLGKGSGPYAQGSIAVRNEAPRVGHHFSLVHVRGGRIVEVVPHFLAEEEIPRPRPVPHIALSTSYASAPGSVGAALEFSPGVWGMEGVNGYLSFVNWRPTVSLGIVSYNAWGRSPGPKAYAATVEIAPFNLECHLPRANIITLRLPGFEMWDGREGLRRYFVTMGVEAPLLFDLWGKLENLNFGIKVYFPLKAGSSADPAFGDRTKVGLFVGYKFRL